MRRIGMLLLLILLFPTGALAGQIFGSLKQNNSSVGNGVGVRIQCGEKGRPIEGATDSYGSYSLYVPQPGKCAFTVYYSGQWSVPYEIYSDQADPVRYDFELVRQDDGSYRLERR